MKKYLIFAITIALLLSFAGIAEASVGYKKDGENIGNAISIDVRNGLTEFDGSTVTLYSNGYKDGVTTNVSTESNLTSAALSYGVVKLEIGSSKSISIANGSAGQMVTFIVTTAGGGTVTITDDQVGAGVVTKTGWDDIALKELNDSVTLLYVSDVIGWIITGQSGVTVT